MLGSCSDGLMADGSRGIVWLGSYPKSGNTWLRVFLANLLASGETPVGINELDGVEHGATRRLFDEFAGVDSSDLTPDEIDDLRPWVYEAMAAESDSRIFLKTHDAYGTAGSGEPILCLPATVAAVYIVRNPLDVAPSYAFHCGVSIDETITTMTDESHTMARLGRRGQRQVPQHIGSWSGHVASWLDAPELSLHVVRYEDLSLRPRAEFGAVADFLGLDVAEDSLDRALACSDFAELRRQEDESGFVEGSPKASRFFRKGRVGSWREELTPAQVDRIVHDHGQVMRRLGYLDQNGATTP